MSTHSDRDNIQYREGLSTYSDRDDRQAENCLNVQKRKTDMLRTLHKAGLTDRLESVYIFRQGWQTDWKLYTTQTVMRARLGTVYTFRQG